MISKEAFLRVFLRKRDAYRALFGEPSQSALMVLSDLRRFCHANATTAVADREGRIDPIASAQLEGRRQVLMRIQQMLRVSEEDLQTMIERIDHE